MITKENIRSINWIASYNDFNNEYLINLKSKMKSYYESNNDYYENINFSLNVWNNPLALPQVNIINEAERANNILEVGCGKANFLLSNSKFASKYTGIDLSKSLINNNLKNFPKSKFFAINDSNKFPIVDNRFDLVFSHFVIEHTIFPQLFLDECLRVLKPGGKLIILCPNFSQKLNLNSQRVGFSQGSGRIKFNEGKYWDSIVTGFDNKIKLPLLCSFFKFKSLFKLQFYINIMPTCFQDKFLPDLDAVYFTNPYEIKKHLASNIDWLIPEKKITNYCKLNRQIYLIGIKQKN